MLTLESLRDLALAHAGTLAASVRSFDLGGRFFDWNAGPRLMGVVNLSPDSWYRESVCLTTEAAIARGRRLALEGAALVDVGAESSVLTATRANDALQMDRLLPVIRGLSEAGILVSAETYRLPVARACLDAGAKVLNLTGTTDAADFFRLAAERAAAVILCYVEGAHVRAVNDFALDEDPVPKLHDFFARRVEEAVRLGVTRILLDPGLGFYYRNLQDSATRVLHQMRTFLNTFRLRELGWPVCHALPHAFEYFREEVRCAEPFFAVLALLGKTDLLRTHEIARVRAVCETLGVSRGPRAL
ncbi:MAG: dihydropteroate synthase [Verrucomicrobiae bacterium]|nr:dihydropteroate synthase [Verrucomicrobiae bacterium]